VDRERIKEVLITGRLTLGPYGEAFEKRFATSPGPSTPWRSATAHGRDRDRSAQHRRCRSDVLVPANTFFATAAAVIAAGARPVLMDTDLRTLSTTAAEVERRLTANTAGASSCTSAAL